MNAFFDAAERLAMATTITSFSGAGLSAESGIGTFRGRDENAHWRRYDPMMLASQQGFAQDPELVMRWYADRRRTLAAASPNAAHRALAADSRIQHVTQNVDDLLERAGAPVERVLHLHGSLLGDRCNADCGFQQSVDLVSPTTLYECPRCGGSMRPTVVWFGEGLDATLWNAAEQSVSMADVLLVVGTSLSVHPAAGLVQLALQNASSIVYVDPEPDTHLLEASERIDGLIVLSGAAGQVLPQLLRSAVQ